MIFLSLSSRVSWELIHCELWAKSLLWITMLDCLGKMGKEEREEVHRLKPLCGFVLDYHFSVVITSFVSPVVLWLRWDVSERGKFCLPFHIHRFLIKEIKQVDLLQFSSASLTVYQNLVHGYYQFKEIAKQRKQPMYEQ